MKIKFANTDQPPTKGNSMNRKKCSIIGFVSGGALLAGLTGCVAHLDGPPHATRYAPPPPVSVSREAVVPPEYVYYPAHQVYYSSSRRHYVYRNGRAWVTRPAPPRVSVDVLFASPSVRLGFHESPSIHHTRVVRQYPRNWAPPGSRNDRPGNRNDRNRNDRRDRR